MSAESKMRNKAEGWVGPRAPKQRVGRDSAGTLCDQGGYIHWEFKEKLELIAAQCSFSRTA